MQCFKYIRRNIFKTTALQADIHAIEGQKSRNEIQTIIIGAGLAGLSAANHLIKNGFERTIVLEATERTGGRVNSKHFGDAFCELGAKWIAIDGTSKNTMFELLQQATTLPKKIQQNNNKDMCYINTAGVKANRKLPALINELFRKLCTTIAIEEKYKTGTLHDLNNVHTYFQAESDKIIKQLFEMESEKELATDIFSSLFKEFGSMLGCCLEYVNIEHLFRMQNERVTINPIYIPIGMNSLLSKIKENIDINNMKMGKPVGEIKWKATVDQDQKTVGCVDGSAFTADHIICTLPLGVLKNFSNYMFKPMLPNEKLSAINNLGFGSPVKIYFEYNKNIRYWFETNLRPLWTRKERKKDLKWTKQIVEISKLPTSNRVIEILIGGQYFHEIEKLPDVELANEVTKLLRTCLHNSKIPQPKSILRSNWSTSACYLGGRPYFSIGSTTSDVNVLAEPLDQTSLLFAGDATILKGFGTVDGARLSGIREAQRIIEFYERPNIEESSS